MIATYRQLASVFSMLMTVLLVDDLSAEDLTHHRHRHHYVYRHQHHHQQQQQNLPTGRMLTHDECNDVCELHKSIGRLTAAQMDYGRALQVVYGVVESLRRELATAR